MICNAVFDWLDCDSDCMGVWDWLVPSSSKPLVLTPADAAVVVVVVRRLASHGPGPAGICQHRHRFFNQN